MQKAIPSPVSKGNEGPLPEKAAFIQKCKQFKVGVLPLPVYLALAAVILLASVAGKLPNDMIGGFAVIMVLGILLSDIGMKLPLLKNIGGPAIMALMIPSLLIYLNLFNSTVTDAVTTLMKEANFLYLYISILVSGSMLGMHRKTLVAGITRIFIPLIVGTIAAVLGGLLVGTLTGYSMYHTFFFIIVPILGGGIGEGILPLSIAYSSILGGHEAGYYVSQMIPSAIIGNVFAIIVAGFLKRLGEKKPHLSGNGTLVKSGDDLQHDNPDNKPKDFMMMGAGLLIACSFFIVGALLADYVGIPGPIVMILMAVLIKCVKALPERFENGAYQLYKFVAGNLTWPLMVGLGMLYVPLKDVAAIISVPYVLTCLAIVFSMVVSGYFVGRKINMYPVDAAIVTVCHSGLGGTGDVAILSASNRMQLMPFAQISTRIGGVSTVIVATILLRFWS